MKSTMVIFICILLVPLASALKTGIVIESESKIYSGCVDVGSGSSVYDVLKKLDGIRDDIKMTIDGELTGMYYLRSVNGLDPKTDGNKYYGWSFFITSEKNDQFTDPPNFYGIGDYKITKEEAIGIKYGYTEFASDWSIVVPPEKPAFKNSKDLCNNLKVNITDIYIDGIKQGESITKRGKIKDVFPGSDLEIRIHVENNYDSAAKLDITDINIAGIIEDLIDGDDTEEEIADFDLPAERRTTKSLKFKIPFEVGAKDRFLRIETKAKDDAGIQYSIESAMDLEIKKESHRLKILEAKLDKNAYSCGINGFLLMDLANIGANKEKVDLQISNEEIGLNREESFELSQDINEASNRYKEQFNIWIPENISKNVYPITITADYGIIKEKEVVNLVVDTCNTKEEVASERDIVGEELVSKTAGAELNEKKQYNAVNSNVNKRDANKSLTLLLSIVLIILVILMIAGLVVVINHIR